MERNRHVSFAHHPDIANVAFDGTSSSVHHEGSDGGPYEEQQQQQPPSSQIGGPLTSSLHGRLCDTTSLQSPSSVPRGYPAESYVPSQHHQYPAAYQLEHSSGVGHPHQGPAPFSRSSWHPPSGSTASAHRDVSAEIAGADPAFRVPHLPAGRAPAPAQPQPQQQQQQHAPRGPPAGVGHGRPATVPSTIPSQDAPMQLMHSDLAVLNARHYDDGRGRGGGGAEIAGPPAAAPRKGPQPPQAEAEAPAPKKRGRGNARPPAAARVGEAAEEEKKRTRGRPRLESTSETPQERRRTQIRLAQRAYRDRKEGAISTLEKEVEDLKAENQKVTQAYQELLARVHRRGGDGGSAPPLAKRPARDDDNDEASSSDTHDDDGDDDDAQPAKRARRGGSDDGPPLSSSSTTMTMTTSGPMMHGRQAAAAAAQPTPLWAGVMVTHAPLASPSFPAATYAGPAALGAAAFLGDGAGASGGGGGGGYEVLAQATPQNASFAAAALLSFDAPWPTGGTWPPPMMGAAAGGGGPPPPSSRSPPAPAPPLPAPTMAPPTAALSLPSPTSFAYLEPTFGRRLHRTQLQRAARLAALQDPPPAALARVFGFAMLFESLDQIKERTLALLTPGERASLFEWRYPFQNLGGAGSHYPPPPPPAPPIPALSSSSSSSSSLTSSPPPPLSLARDPYAMGPMDPRVGRIRDTLVSLGGEIALPGFDGIFWDPDEIDFYLRHNGVVIPPAADHHIVEIADGAFGPPPDTAAGDDNGSSASGSAAAATTCAPDHHPGVPATTCPPQSQNPPQAGNWSLAADFLDAHYTTTAAPPSGLQYNYGGGGGASDMHMGFGAGSRRRVWQMDVGLFIENLASKTTCLGRSPGVRPRDVDAAFWASVRDPASAL